MAEIKQHSDKVWLIEAHTDEYDVRGAVITGDEYAVVLDTLSHPNDMHEVNELLGELPFYIVYTHADWDHIWGNAGLSRQPLAIVAHELAYNRFLTDVPQTLREKQLAEPNKWDEIVIVQPTILFNSQMILRLGDITLQLHTLPGHTKDCIIGFIPELGIWLGGDTVETPLPVIENREDVAAWSVALGAWSMNENVHSVIPAHGAVGSRDEIRKTYDYLSQLLSGGKVSVPDNLSDFYRTTHQENLNIMGK